MGGKQLAGSEVAVTTQSIVMYTARFCPFCIKARQLLFHKGWDYEEILLNRNPEKRDELIKKSGRKTVPQIWLGRTHVGGFDELLTLERCGQLDALVMGVSDE